MFYVKFSLDEEQQLFLVNNETSVNVSSIKLLHTSLIGFPLNLRSEHQEKHNFAEIFIFNLISEGVFCQKKIHEKIRSNLQS